MSREAEMPAARPFLLRSEPRDPAQSALAECPDLSLLFAPTLPPGAEEPVLWASQDIALADLTRTRFSSRAAILLRRRRAGQSDELWRNGLHLLSALLEVAGTAAPQLFTVTAQARDETAALLERDIQVLPPPRLTAAHEMHFEWSADGKLLRSAKTERIMTADAMHLGRLRRNATLAAEADAPPDVHDLCDWLGAVRTPADYTPPKDRQRNRVLVVVSNGTGLGHVTRTLAIARHLAETGNLAPVFWCYSRAAHLVAEAGYPVISRQTASHLGCDIADWRQLETADLAAWISVNAPLLVIKDAGRVGQSLAEALRDPCAGRTGLALVRRGLWHPDRSDARLEDEQFCDLVVEPGDIAASADRGATATAQACHSGIARRITTPPVVATRLHDLHSREEARRILGLPESGAVCLASLGAAEAEQGLPVLLALGTAARAHGVILAILQSPLAARLPASLPGTRLSAYPIAPCTKAFDGIAAAAGYNTFHEALTLTTCPLLFVPTLDAALDDQAARAGYAATQGWARTMPTGTAEDLRQVAHEFMQDVAAQVTAPRPPDITDIGVQIAAEALAGVAAHYRETE